MPIFAMASDDDAMLARLRATEAAPARTSCRSQLMEARNISRAANLLRCIKGDAFRAQKPLLPLLLRVTRFCKLSSSLATGCSRGGANLQAPAR